MKSWADIIRKKIYFLKFCGFLLLPIVLFFVSIDNLDGKLTICLFKNIFGNECYGCGITKAVISAIQLDFVRAFNYNKLIIIVMPLLVYFWGKEISKYYTRLKTIC